MVTDLGYFLLENKDGWYDQQYPKSLIPSGDKLTVDGVDLRYFNHRLSTGTKGVIAFTSLGR
jgi:hypothetical protein